jgi:hypothetical protein
MRSWLFTRVKYETRDREMCIVCAFPNKGRLQFSIKLLMEVAFFSCQDHEKIWRMMGAAWWESGKKFLPCLWSFLRVNSANTDIICAKTNQQHFSRFIGRILVELHTWLSSLLCVYLDSQETQKEMKSINTSILEAWHIYAASTCRILNRMNWKEK